MSPPARHLRASLIFASAFALSGCHFESTVRFAPKTAASQPPATLPAPGSSLSAAALPAASPPSVAKPPAELRTSRRPDAAYPLDSVERTLADGQLSCPNVDARNYGGTSLRFSPEAKVIDPFRQRLVAFEAVVRDVSQRVYGRWPSTILVAASYGCRSVGGESRKLSEHALGNAIDVTGFEFAPAAPFALPAWTGTPAALLDGFQVRVDRHWNKTQDPASSTHARFLAEVTRELVARDVFRTLLGPAQPDHQDHFHFDMAPWNYVNL